MFMLVIWIAKVVWPQLWSLKELNWYLIHTVAIWTFTFHKISGFVKGDFEGQFQTTLKAKDIHFLIWKFRFIILILLLSLQNLSNPVLFTHCCCYSKELTCLNCDLMQKYMRINLTFINSHPQLRSHYLCHSTVAVSRHTGLKKYTYLLVHSTTLPWSVQTIGDSNRVARNVSWLLK